jgi:hypothetical protein
VKAGLVSIRRINLASWKRRRSILIQIMPEPFRENKAVVFVAEDLSASSIVFGWKKRGFRQEDRIRCNLRELMVTGFN